MTISIKEEILLIIQARMNSSRLPGKVLADICGKPCLQHVLERVSQSNKVNNIVVATTTNPVDNPVVDLCNQLGYKTFCGDENDVLGRLYGAAEIEEAVTIVRITADCPMIDPDVIDEVISTFLINNHDYVSNTIKRTYPDGLDVEVMSIDALREAHKKATAPFLREHVTPYITGKRPDLGSGDFSIGHVEFVDDFSYIRWTLDTKEDLHRIRALVSKLPEDYHWLQALSIAKRRTDLSGSVFNKKLTGEISLRLAIASDVDILFEWVNTPSSLINKVKNNALIEWSDHQNWFNKRLSNTNVRIWIVEQDEQAIGQVRVEYVNDKLLIDIFIDSLYRGKSYGLTALKLLMEQCQVVYPDVPLCAVVKSENLPSLHLFRQAGFHESRVEENIFYFVYKYSNDIAEGYDGN